MTVLARALGAFIAPAPSRPDTQASSASPLADAGNTARRTPSPPVVPSAYAKPDVTALKGAPPGVHGAAVGAAPLAAARVGAAPLAAAGVGAAPLAAAAVGAAPLAAAEVVTSAAVLGRPGEAEPVAAALALVLRREARAKAAAVAVVGTMPAEATGGGGGRAAARRLAARLEAHGLEARVRGRLAWVGLDPADPHLVVAARRVTLVAAPAVLAINSPRTAATDAALAEQDLLVVVTAEPEGPLARLAAGGLCGVPVVTVAPLTRGPARSLARAGVRPARPVRHLIAATREPRP